jgi:hypothetical protein
MVLRSEGTDGLEAYLDNDPKKPHKNTKMPGLLWNPLMPAVRSDDLRGGPARPLTVKEAAVNARAARQPLSVGHGVNYDSVPWPVDYKRVRSHQHELTMKAPLPNPSIPQAAAGMMVPPMIFTFVAYVLTFYQHFRFGRLAWVFALCGLIPLFAAVSARSKATARGRRNPWHLYYIIMFAVSWILAAVVSEINYQYFMHTFYELQSMRTYTNIDPSEVSGMRVMDAASVGFVDDARVVTDMAMSYTTFDVYCVAPISTASGLPSQGGKLISYDFWAVGINCCSSAKTNFNCGQLDNPRAKMGMRLVDNDQVSMFKLAVQQAEAAYNVEARHPVFFYWTQDPDKQMVSFFGHGFKNYVMAGTAHFALSFLVLAMFMVIPRDYDEADIDPFRPGQDEHDLSEATKRFHQHNDMRRAIIEHEKDHQPGLRPNHVEDDADAEA